MAIENFSSTTMLAERATTPFSLNLIIFLVVFAINVLYSSVLLWLISRLFHVNKSHNKIKTASIVALISNISVSLLFGIIRLVAGRVFGQAGPPSKLLSITVIILAFVATTAINLSIAKKFYKLPAKQAFYIILFWTLISFLVTNLASHLLVPFVAHLFSVFFPVAVIDTPLNIIPPPA